MKKHLSGIPSLGSWLLTFHVELSLTTIDRTVNNTIRPALCQYDKPDNSARLSVFSLVLHGLMDTLNCPAVYEKLHSGLF